jgi:hypothetical protein
MILREPDWQAVAHVYADIELTRRWLQSAKAMLIISASDENGRL